MAVLYFKIGADYEAVIRLRDEIKKLENQLKNFGKSTPEQEIHKTEERLAATRQEFTKLTVEAAKAGAAMENAFKKNSESLLLKMEQVNAKIAETIARINQSAEKILKAQEQLAKATGTRPQSGASSGTTASANQTETAFVQAQAKAYEELEREINNVLGTREANVKRILEEQNAIRLINEEIKKLNKLQGSSPSAAIQNRLAQLNDDLLTHKAALSELRLEVNNNVKIHVAERYLLRQRRFGKPEKP